MTGKCIRTKVNEKQIERCKETLKIFSNELQTVATITNIIGNEVRLKILFLLYKEKSLCVCDLSDILNMNTPAISQHLRKLKDRNLVKTKRQGQTIYYSLTENHKKLPENIFKYVEELKTIKQ